MKITTDLMYARDEREDNPKMVWFARCSLCAKMSEPSWTEEGLASKMAGWLLSDTQDACPDCVASGAAR